MTFHSRNATIKWSIGSPEIVRHHVKHTQIILKLTKFYAHID